MADGVGVHAVRECRRRAGRDKEGVMKLSTPCRLLSVLTLITALGTADALAQGPGRVRGRVTDADTGEPLADALIKVEVATDRQSVRQDARDRPPVEETTGDDGRFSMIGFGLGPHDVTVTKDGYSPVVLQIIIQGAFDPIDVPMAKELTILEQLLGREALVGLDAVQLDANLTAADAAFNAGDFRAAIGGYKELLEVLPQATILYQPLGAAHRALGENAQAVAAFEKILETDPDNEEIQAEIATTKLAMGDAAAAANPAGGGRPGGGGLALGLASSREDFYNLGELAFANGDVDRAQGWYEKATGADPNWVKPRFKLALVALNKGDLELAKQHLRQVVEMDAGSEEGQQAEATLAALP